MVNMAGHVFLMDFGTSRSLDETTELTQTKTVAIGTPYYMAPEQFLQGTADARSDIYAFGAVVYEMVAGRRPLEGESIAEIVQAHLHQVPPPPSQFAPVPPALEALVLRCLAKKPEERFQTMDEVVSALEVATAEVPRADITRVVQRASEDARRAEESSVRPTEVLPASPPAQTVMLSVPRAADAAGTLPVSGPALLRVVAGPLPAGHLPARGWEEHHRPYP